MGFAAALQLANGKSDPMYGISPLGKKQSIRRPHRNEARFRCRSFQCKCSVQRLRKRNGHWSRHRRAVSSIHLCNRNNAGTYPAKPYLAPEPGQGARTEHPLRAELGATIHPIEHD